MPLLSQWYLSDREKQNCCDKGQPHGHLLLDRSVLLTCVALIALNSDNTVSVSSVPLLGSEFTILSAVLDASLAVTTCNLAACGLLNISGH